MRAKPFLKFVGGKGQLLPELRMRTPDQFGHYFELFIGGGALFFDLANDDILRDGATISDVNPDLVVCYLAVRDDVEGLIDDLSRRKYTEAEYYATRDIFNARGEPSATARAAAFVYMNKTGFNGLCRYSSKGRFNVPFGAYTNPTICDAVNLRACSAALQGVEILCSDAMALETRPQPGDFVYYDPPYVPASDTASFTAYASSPFGPVKQELLAAMMRRQAARGVHCMASNSDTPEARELYGWAHVDTVQAARAINSNGARRGKVGEIIARSEVWQ